jgi:hypothetical protein
MNLSDRRVVEFRQWAEKRFAIGSGGYPEAEDLLSVVMAQVDLAGESLAAMLGCRKADGTPDINQVLRLARLDAAEERALEMRADIASDSADFMKSLERSFLP